MRNLVQNVIGSSEADEWNDAVTEWEIVDCEEDEKCLKSCICGKEKIKYLYTIQNIYNRNILYPIGSQCINKFGRADMRERTSLMEEQFRLLHAVEDNRFITLDSDLFSRKLLRWLYDEGAFDNIYNNYDGEDDYEFMIKMFNKRDKSSITIKQNKKIRAIIVNSIKPFLMDRLEEKVIG